MSLADMVKAAGVVGAGGAGFPTHVKLGAPAEWFIVNASECEPLIETDKFLCRTFPDKIVEAAESIGKCLGAEHVVIALKREYQEEITALQEVVNGRDSGIKLHTTRAFFPVGDEFVLVEEVTGRVIPEGGLPIGVGVIMDNVGTVLNVYYAMHGAPVTDKYLSVAGEVEAPLMLRVPIGTTVMECIRVARPTLDTYGVILGGPMMGKVLTVEELGKAVVTKTTGSILILPRKHPLICRAYDPIERIRTRAKSTCLQCRACTDLCPRHTLGHHIHPHLLMRSFAVESLIQSDKEYLKAFWEAANCSACGACELFSCPMGLSPRRVNQYIKGRLRERNLPVERSKEATVLEEKEIRRIPINRLIARLGLTKYGGHEGMECLLLTPNDVYIPFLQHIGRPAVPVKTCGERVKKGELLAAAAESGLSANIHSSISGIVQAINENGALVEAVKE